MLADFLHTLVGFIDFLWPIARVDEWEQAVILVCGKFWKTVGPGIYLKLPWFMQVHTDSVALMPITTGRSDITTKDGRTLSFSATALVRITDIRRAVVDTHDSTHTAQGILTSALAEKLAEVEPERLAPDRRARLNSSLVAMVKEEMAEIGIEVKWVRFTSFVLNPKTLRVLSEAAPIFG